MNTAVKTETEDQNIMAACKVMNDNKIGCVVIVKIQNNEQQPVGILTERDILRIMGRLTVDLRKPLTGYMSSPVISIRPNASIKEAMQIMNSRDIRRLVVTDNNNKLQGIVTEKDIFKELSKSQELLNRFVDENATAEFKEYFGRFSDYMFGLLPKV
ncbi:MAG TPA: CBS domain-containing protein [Nitrososphaeraceae archaeon]|jgi:CBS domain-containing protein